MFMRGEIPYLDGTSVTVSEVQVTPDLKHARYGSPSAEDCHTGEYASTSIVLVASDLTRCNGEHRGYQRLQYVFVGTSPFQGVPTNQNFSDYIAAPGRPELPADQTVRLNC